MRVGSIVYATTQGLGYLAKSFYDNGIITDVVIVDRPSLHATHPLQRDWFPNAPIVSSFSAIQGEGERLARKCDAMLFLETPHVWELISYTKQIGKKAILCVMYECLHQKVWEHQPDAFLCPSQLDFDHIANCMALSGESLVFQLPVPVIGECRACDGGRTCMMFPCENCKGTGQTGPKWKLRTRAEVFVHNAGHGGLRGRNGTAELLQAIQYLRSPAKVIVRTQSPLKQGIGAFTNDERIEIRMGSVPYEKLWDEGDVFVFPEKFNGLSLPLQEARAAGMLVMATDRFPMNTWLPNPRNVDLEFQTMTDPGEAIVDSGFFSERRVQPARLLIKPEGYTRQRIGPPYPLFDEAVLSPRKIAETIDSWFGMNLESYSLSGREWAKTMSWQALKPLYLDILERLVGQ